MYSSYISAIEQCGLSTIETLVVIPFSFLKLTIALKDVEPKGWRLLPRRRFRHNVGISNSGPELQAKQNTFL